MTDRQKTICRRCRTGTNTRLRHFFAHTKFIHCVKKMPTALYWGKYHTVDMLGEVLLDFDVVTSLVVCHCRSSLQFYDVMLLK